MGTLGADPLALEDGLPGMYVPDLAVADDGRLWMLASGRLTSFDGLEFETHPIDVRTIGSSGTLAGMGTGRGDTIWVTAGHRLLTYVNGRTQLRAEGASVLRDVWQTRPDGRVWVLDDLGVLLLQGQEFDRVARFVEGWNQGLIATLDPRESVFLHLLMLGNVVAIPPEFVVDPQPLPEAWPTPLSAAAGVVSRRSEEGTEVSAPDGELLARLPPGQEGLLVLRDSRRLLWIARPGVVDAFDPSGQRVASITLAADAVVTSAAEDTEGNVWIGTVTDGLYRIRPRPVTLVGAAQGLTDGQVFRLSAGDAGRVLAVDAEWRVTRIGPGGADTLFERAGPADPIVPAATADRRGTIWMSVQTASNGPRLEGITTAGDTIGIPIPTLHAPYRIVEHPTEDGVLWLSGGGFRVRPYAEGGPEIEGPFMPNDWDVRDMVVASDGTVWVTGASGSGRITPDGFEAFTDGGLPDLAGRALHEGSDGSLWLGRYLGGLVRYRDGDFREIREADGLWDDVVTAMLEDDFGNLWMAGNRGIHRVSLQDLEDFLAGRIARVRGRGYGSQSGLRNAEASGWHGYESPDGRLWFPTFKGAAMVDPGAALALERTAPGIRIRGVQTSSHRLAVPSGSAGAAPPRLVLPRGERRVDVLYAATLLSGHGGVRYEVRLDGVDADWGAMGPQRQVSYGNLPAGTHRMRVRSFSGAGVASANEATFVLEVPPFFYETRSFAALLALVAAGALWLAYHLRLRRLRAREIHLEQIVDERTVELALANREVEAQARQLRSLDEAKSRFFANVSHELRTPLTLVQGPLQDVLDGRLGPTPESVRRQVATVLASGRRLGELIEQLLDVARLESGTFRLDFQSVDLRHLLARLATSFAALAESRGITFKSSLPSGPTMAVIDADQIEKVWSNLLANAIKFTPPGGWVELRVEIDPEASELIVEVEDDGPGIPTSEVARIFDRFHQVDASSRRAHGGAGLGLALVREVTELHGGSVEVRTEEGMGSCFTVRLPLAGPGDESEESATDGEARPSAGGGEGDDERPTILVVEDNADLRDYLRRHLEDRYRVVEAANGALGLAAARAEVPDLILCDLMMPQMDGEELCRAVRDDPELAYLPLIVVTARASRDSRVAAFEGGADDYLVKPFDPEELRLRIHNTLASRMRLRERLRAEGHTLHFVPLASPRAGIDRDFSSQLEAVLREHMGDEDFGIDALARSMAISRATLYRKTDAAFGLPPMEVLWRYRLAQAAHWLEGSSATVSEVTYACGFKTVPHFTRRFKETYHMTPAAYRDR